MARCRPHQNQPSCRAINYIGNGSPIGGLPASLVNGRTIFADFNIHEITYHHVELDAHDIVLAEGCAAESYLDTGTKQDFEGEVTALHPVFTAAGGKTCVPLILTGEALRVARLGIEAAVPAGIQGTERMRVTFGGTSAIG